MYDVPEGLALHSHMFRSHGVISTYRLWAFTATCPCCLRYFHTRDRLACHFKPQKGVFPECSIKVRLALDPMSREELDALDEAERLVTKSKKAKCGYVVSDLPRQQAEGPRPTWAM